MMTENEKKDWLANATAERLLRQFETSVRWHAAYEARNGGLDKETLEFANEVELAKQELLKRLAQ